MGTIQIRITEEAAKILKQFNESYTVAIKMLDKQAKTNLTDSEFDRIRGIIREEIQNLRY